MRVGIIGLGYVGLTMGIAAADRGVDVYGIEISDHIKNSLKNNRAHFFEPGLDELIEKHNGESFHVVEHFPNDKAFDAFVITVGTPLKDKEKKPNFDYIQSALRSLANIYDSSQLVILRSTVSVGTTRNVVIPFLAKLSGKKEKDVLVAMCPERTIEGKAVEELKSLPQIISGNNYKALEIANELFLHLTPNIIPVSSLEEAELVKLYCNTYRDLNFAIGNAFCLAAQTFGIDGMNVIKHANQGYNRTSIALPGFVAGPCLEKDAYILTNNMTDCDSKRFILDGRWLNESLEDHIVEWVQVRLKNPSDCLIVISGMAFKGQPPTSDLRGSSSVNIARKLYSLGYKLVLHDYVADMEEMKALSIGDVGDDLSEACRNADMLLVLNNNKQYGEFQIGNDVGQKMSLPILDAWGVCRNLRKNEGAVVYTLGDFMLELEALR